MPNASARRGRPPDSVTRKLRSIVLIAALVWLLIPPLAAVAAPEPVNPQGKYLQVSVGELHSCAVTEDGDAGCWGQTNNLGAAPAKVVGPFRSVSVGLDHTCAVRSDRSVACWGLNAEGQAPARVAGLFSSVSSGRTRSCALRTNGNMLCWSWDYLVDAPDQWEIPGPFLSMSLFDSDDTCAIRANGDATCWDTGGNSLSEQAGPFTMISAAFGRACALKTDGAIVCWVPGDTTGPPTTVAGPFTSWTWAPPRIAPSALVGI